ncbi:MAG: hypothetical protein V4493_00695 [Pseudomonadota bacterium]
MASDIRQANPSGQVITIAISMANLLNIMQKIQAKPKKNPGIKI